MNFQTALKLKWKPETKYINFTVKQLMPYENRIFLNSCENKIKNITEARNEVESYY